ncbi:MAG: cold-shock protein [Verrucomicrobia bacterium]|nr:cold-shock protein [Verrucomicrobiota bacterium]
MARGTVSRFDPEKGYGSISPDKRDTELFVHESSVTVRNIPLLTVGQVVYFEVLDGPHGPQAVEVRPITRKPAPPSP